MKLGCDAWSRQEWYYYQLTLRRDGDEVEAYGDTEHALDAELPAYVRFWKRHVAPSTQRPASIETRDAAHELVSLIAQRSYAVFCNIVECMDQLEIIKREGLGNRHRNAVIALKFCGDALVMFSELERLIAGPPNAFTKSVGCLADKLGVIITPLSRSQSSAWIPLRENVVVYRHYLTHNGMPLTLTAKSDGAVYVLRREHLEGTNPVSWIASERKHGSEPTHWHELKDACNQILKDTVALLDFGYSALVDELGSFVWKAAYQQLWGWTEGMPEIPKFPVYPGGGYSARRPTVLFGVTASDDLRPYGSAARYV